MVALATARAREATQEQGPFRRQVRVHLPAGTQPMRVGAADLDRDGKLDLIVAGESGSVLAYRGDGKGGFSSEPRVFNGGPGAGDLAIGDLNGDSRADIVLANHGHPQATILLGDGRGGLVPAPGSPLQLDLNPHSAARRCAPGTNRAARASDTSVACRRPTRPLTAALPFDERLAVGI